MIGVILERIKEWDLSSLIFLIPKEFSLNKGDDGLWEIRTNDDNRGVLYRNVHSHSFRDFVYECIKWIVTFHGDYSVHKSILSALEELEPTAKLQKNLTCFNDFRGYLRGFI